LAPPARDVGAGRGLPPGSGSGTGSFLNETSPSMLSKKGLGDVARVLGTRSSPDIKWISQVTGVPPDQARGGIAELEKEVDNITDLARRITDTGRAYYAQFPAPLDLFALVRLTRPKQVVESGVSSGISSAFMLLGIKSNIRGILHSIDFPVERHRGAGNESWGIPSGLSSGWAVPPKLRKGWDLRLGRSEELLDPLLGEIGKIDFYCHDSPVDINHFKFEMKTIRSHLRPGSLVVADNTDWETFERTARLLGAVAYRRRSSSLGAFRVPNH
jgi:hypothetical protein